MMARERKRRGCLEVRNVDTQVERSGIKMRILLEKEAYVRP